jgi:hypothetical protein
VNNLTSNKSFIFDLIEFSVLCYVNIFCNRKIVRAVVWPHILKTVRIIGQAINEHLCSYIYFEM